MGRVLGELQHPLPELSYSLKLRHAPASINVLMDICESPERLNLLYGNWKMYVRSVSVDTYTNQADVHRLFMLHARSAVRLHHRQQLGQRLRSREVRPTGCFHVGYSR